MENYKQILKSTYYKGIVTSLSKQPNDHKSKLKFDTLIK